MKQFLLNNAKRMLKSFILFSGLLLYTVVKAQPGTPDPTFGVGGKVINQLFGRIRCTALQKDGKILAAGLAYEETIIIVRYNTNGTLDQSFGTNGKVLTDLVPRFHLYYSQATALAIENDGKILVTGYGYRNTGAYGDYDILLARYNTDGSLDAGFGKSGIVINDFGDEDEQANAIALLPGGKILIGGISNNDQLLARYNTNGSTDSSFAGKGWLTTDFFGFDYVNSFAMQPDGRMIAAGTSGFGEQFFVLIRYNRNGTIDSSFGINGKVATDFGHGGDQLASIVLQPDGKIIGTGKTGGATGLEGKIAVIRYLSTGSIDSSFGTNGKVKTKPGAKFSNGTAILLQPNGKIVVSGGNYSLMNSHDWDFSIVRYNNDGTVNKAFGNNGAAITDFGGLDYATCALLQPDGKIVSAGALGNYGFALVRYNGDNTVSPSYVKIKQQPAPKNLMLHHFQGLKSNSHITTACR